MKKLSVRKTLALALSGFGLLSASAIHAADLGTGFTYQGELKAAGAPVSGDCDFDFELWDAATNGLQIGSTQTVSNVTLDNGRFTVLLNSGGEFGPDPFAGQARWLQIGVCCPSGSCTPSTLSPRQEVTPAPNAIFSDNTRGMFVDSQGNVGIGTTAPQHIFSVALPSGRRAMFGSQTGSRTLIGWDANNGVIKGVGAGNSTRGLLFSTGSENSNSVRMRITGGGDVGIGTTNPQAKLHVDGGAVRAGQAATTSPAAALEVSSLTSGGSSSYDRRAIAVRQVTTEGDTRLFADYGPHVGWGIYHRNNDNTVHFTNGRGDGFESWQESAPDGSTDLVGSVWRVDLGTGDTMIDGNVGLGTTTPSARLHIGGTPGVDGIQYPDGTLQTTGALPGAAQEVHSDGIVVSLTTSYQNLLSRSIICPTSGYVLVIGSVGAFANIGPGGCTEAEFGVSNVSASLDPDQAKYWEFPPYATGHFKNILTMQKIFAVNQGQTTFHIVGRDVCNYGQIWVQGMTLSLVFIPNSYGTVAE